MPNEENRATYRYTADEQREMDALRRRYTFATPEDDLAALQRIDSEVTRRATIKAVVLGVAGTLVFGGGLSMVLVSDLMGPGIAVGCLGIAVMASMPALHGWLIRRERKKAAPRVAALARPARNKE